MMASRLVLLRFVGYVFVCSFVAVIWATPIGFPNRYTYFDMIAYWSNHSCVFPPITTFQRDALSTDSLVLQPCISGEQDDRRQTDDFTGQLCDALYMVSKALCVNTVSQNDIAPDKVNPYVEDERWDVCKDAQTAGKKILVFMTRDRELCEQYCLSSTTLGPVCRLLVAGVVSYMRSNGEWKANEGRSVIATQDRTQTGTEKGTSNTKRIQNPKSREDILTRDHFNVEPGASSEVNKPRLMTNKTQEDASNGDKGPISRVNQPGSMEGETENDDGKVKGPVVNQPEPGEGYKQKDASNGDKGPISRVNQPGSMEGETENDDGKVKGPVVNQPEPGEGYKQKDASNGDKGPISRVNQPGSMEGETENDDGKVKGPVVNQPEPMESQTEKDDDNGKGPFVNQPEPGEEQTDKDTGNREGSISGVNQLGSRTDYTQEYGDELEPEASSRATQPVEQSTVEGITNVSSSQGGTDKVLSRVDVDMSRTNSKADNAEERNIGEGGSDKYHSIETNKEAIVRGGIVREGTDNHTKASEPKNKDAAENKEAATGSSVHPLGPVEDSDYPSFDEDEDEDPDNIDNEYEDHKFAADDENDNRDFEISSDTKKVKQQDGVVKIPKQMDAFEEEESSGHFMAYFVTAVVLCIAGYVLYHNKQKIIAFVLEGRRDAQRRRTTSSGTAKYTKLQPSVEEVMPSLDKSAATKNFIY